MIKTEPAVTPASTASKPLWPVAALILSVVFAPAFLAFILTLLRQ